ncbi:unnamed protein product [Chrysoparadoxa australica]
MRLSCIGAAIWALLSSQASAAPGKPVTNLLHKGNKGPALTQTQPASGTVTTNPDGSFLYTPEDDFLGTVTFDFSITSSDGQDLVSVTVDITRTVSVSSM